ncbi:MAG TPA: transcriptional repressor LexA [Phycisphaerales bacterium]|nr:transcriptional repressor LexA [Phycisphaerales bacterium]
MELLTEKQRKVFAFIEVRLRAGNPPSQREIARHFGLAQNAVHQLVGYLKQKGYLSDSGGHRGLRLSKEYLNEKRRTEGIPVVGRVAAGEPILAQENIDEYADLKELLGLPADAFLLKVSGESMIDEGIMDGDFVAVRPSKTIENGKIAVVLLDDETTVKRVSVQRDRIALQPANKAAGYKTKYVKRGSKRVQIVGRVIGCIRKI